jgi:DnaJ-domain-containing protein 1
MDYFAVLGLSRSPVLEEKDLKEAWHQAAATTANSEEIHRAYAVLREPAKRIEHLLTLAGKKTAHSEKPGATLFDLFFSVADVLRKSDAVSARISTANTALERAALTHELLASLDGLAVAQQSISSENLERKQRLLALSENFPDLTTEAWKNLATLGNDFAFLGKWKQEIEKRETRLQETLLGKIV